MHNADRLTSPTAASWWTGAEHGRPFDEGLPCRAAARSHVHSQVSCRLWRPITPRTGSSCKRPRSRAAIHQHHFYTASALAVDVPRGGAGAPPRSRGDSLHGLVHTSPIGSGRAPPGTSVATDPVYVHAAAAVCGGVSCRIKKQLLRVRATAAEPFSPSKGDCSLPYELGFHHLRTQYGLRRRALQRSFPAIIIADRPVFCQPQDLVVA